MTTRCPSVAEIRTFLAATSDATSETGRHLNGCEPCQRRMARIIGGHQGADESAAAESFAFDEKTPPVVTGYSFEKLLGSGGMGQVWKARQRVPNRLVAVKFFRKSAAVPEVAARVRREADAAARVQHTNLVTVYEVREASEAGPFIVMEYVRGGTLADRIARGPVDPVQACRWVRTVAAAVHAAHADNVVHRDLKPANVLLTKDGTPKVSDFGIALCQEAGDGRSVAGTIHYMAPEQARGEAADARPDVYSLGVILFELLTGIKPFPGETRTVVLLAQELRTPPLADQHLKSVPRAVSVICQKCLHPRPDRRYASADDLAADLGRYLAGQPIQAMPVGRAERGRMWVNRNRSLSAAIGLGLALLFVATPLLVVLRRDANQADAEAAGASKLGLSFALDQLENDLEADIHLPDGDPVAARAFERTVEKLRQHQSLLSRTPASALAHLPAVAADGRRAASVGNWVAAEAAISTCLRELRPAFDQMPADEARLLTAQLLMAKSSALRNLGRFADATESARAARVEIEQPVCPERIAEQVRATREVLFQQAACLWITNRRREAGAHYAEGVRHAERLAADSGTMEDRLALAWGLVNRTECLGAVPDPERLLADAERGCALLEQIGQSQPRSSRLAVMVVEARFVVARHALGFGDLAAAKTHASSGGAFLRSARERFPTRFARSTREIEGLCLQADIALAEGQPQPAVEYARSATKAVEACRRANPDDNYVLKQSVFVYDTLASALGAAGQPDEAAAALDGAIRDAVALATAVRSEDAVTLSLAKRRLRQAEWRWRAQPSAKAQEAVGGVAADVLAWAGRSGRTEGDRLAAFAVLCDCLLPATILTADEAWTLAVRVRSFTQSWGVAPGCSDPAKAAIARADLLVGVSHSRCGRTDEAVRQTRQAVAELDRLTKASADGELLQIAAITYASAAAVFRAAGLADEEERATRRFAECERAFMAGRR